MKKLNLLNSFRAIAFAGLCLSSLQVSAQWKLVKELEATYSTDVTPSGNLLLSDYRYDYDGGIYLSTDKGENWEKTNAEDYMYSKFIHFGDYIFASGGSTCIARSADNGKTWESLFYEDAVKDVLGDQANQTVAYAMAVHNGKLFVGDFCQGGIVYSEDYGKTWKKTDINSLTYSFDDEDEDYGGKYKAMGGCELKTPKLCSGAFKGKDKEPETYVENIYQLVDYNGHLYAFGIYFVFMLDDETLSWIPVRADSNFMAVSTQYKNTLVLGRSVMNETFSVPFLLTLDENGEWGEVDRPVGLIDNNVRSLASDDNNIYAGLQTRGLYFTPNFGDEWYNISDGLPYNQYSAESERVYLSPLTIVPADDCVYLAVYNYPGAPSGSGLYKIDRKDLDDIATGISTPLPSSGNGQSLKLQFGNRQVSFVAGDVPTTLTVWDASGRRVAQQAVRGTAQIRFSTSGVYTYHANYGGQMKTGKFLVK